MTFIRKIIDLMPDAIPADYDGPLLEFAKAIEQAARQDENEQCAKVCDSWEVNTLDDAIAAIRSRRDHD